MQFIEEQSSKGFCSEQCIEDFYAPLILHFESLEIKHRKLLGIEHETIFQQKDDKSLIEEAQKSGVKHFIYTSVYTASADHPVDFFRTKYFIEQFLIKSGLNYTILQLPAFMEWHVYNLLGKNIVQKGKTTFIVPLKKKVILNNVKIDIGNRQLQRN